MSRPGSAASSRKRPLNVSANDVFDHLMHTADPGSPCAACAIHPKFQNLSAIGRNNSLAPAMNQNQRPITPRAAVFAQAVAADGRGRHAGADGAGDVGVPLPDGRLRHLAAAGGRGVGAGTGATVGRGVGAGEGFPGHDRAQDWLESTNATIAFHLHST